MGDRGVTVVASHDHYRDHLAPITAHLQAGRQAALVAGYGDLVAARRHGFTRFVVAQHGAGQSYSNDHPHYPGGKGHDDVGLFLVPNEHAAQRWRDAYPSARVEVVGSPHLDDLPSRQVGPVTVAVTFHWDLYLVPESRSAFPWFRDVLPELAKRFRMIGTSHPRRRGMAHVYERAGIEYVPDFADVCRRADVLVADNTSAMFEFAATGRPVVVMDAPHYRTDVEHGLRFWDAADVGVRVGVPSDLAPAIERALELRADDVAARERALDVVYAYRSGAGERAADVIGDWLA